MDRAMRLSITAGFDLTDRVGPEAIALAIQLAKDFDVVLDPLWVRGGVPAELALLLTKDPSGPVDVSLTFGSPFAMHQRMHDKARTRVAWPVWDSEEESSPLTINGFDLVVGQSPAHVEQMQIQHPRAPYSFCPLGVVPEHFPYMDRRIVGLPLQVGVIGPREVMLEAWELADLPDGARLVGIDHGIDRFQRAAAYEQIDLLVSTEYGIQNDRTCMEFMATGGAVAAAPVGGHMNWMHEDSAYAVGLEAPEELAGLLTMCGTGPGRELLLRKGRVAAHSVRASLSWEKTARRLMGQIGRAM